MISVAMATYNGEENITKQVMSILQCLSEDDEIVISDDGSCDKTIAILKGLNDKRIKIINGPRLGINKNFENAISHCAGDYIFLSDQDDEWIIGKLESVITCFKRNNCMLVMHDAVVIDNNDMIIDDSFFTRRKVKHGVISNIIKGSYHGCCMALSKEFVKYILPIPKAGFYHDQWIGLLAEYYDTPFFLDKKLLKYYRRGNNSSSYEKQLPILKQLNNRVELIIHFLGRILSKRY